MTRRWCAVVTAVSVSVLVWAGPVSAADYREFRPEGSGPFPVVLFAAGCSGFAPSVAPTFYPRMAKRLQGDGYLVLFVDSLGSRGLQSCTGKLTQDEAGRDILSALAHVRKHATARRDAVTVIGWSFGAGAVMAALAELPAQPAPFRAVLLSPSCRGRKPWKAPADMLVFFGGKDTVAPPELCRDALAKSASGDRIKTTTYPEAFHGFDADELPARTTYPLGVIGYHKESADAAWAEIDAFLKASAAK